MPTSTRAFAVGLLLMGLVVVSPTLAQRGGGARGGGGGRSVPSFGGGGFHSAPSFGGASGFRSSPATGSGFSNVRPTAGIRSYATPSRGYAINRGTASSGRGVYTGDHRVRAPYPAGRRQNYGVGYPYGLAAWYAPDYLGFPDSGFYDDSTDYGAPQPSEYVEAPTVEPEAYDAPVQGSYMASTPQPPPPPPPEAAVTLIFKDARPRQTIHNYMLTRTTLTVLQGQRQHDIAVADLDMAATVKVNREAGVAFQPVQ